MSFISIPALIRGRYIRDAFQFHDSVFATRQERLRALMADCGVDGLLIFADSLENSPIGYLTFYTNVIPWSNALLVVTQDNPPYLIAAIPPRDAKRVEKFIAGGVETEFSGLSLVANDHTGARAVAYIHEQKMENRKWKGVNLKELPHKALTDIESAIGPVGDFSKRYALLRSIKTPAELSAIAQATAIARRMALDFVQAGRPGVTQKSASAEIDRRARYDGAEDVQILVGTDNEGGTLHFPGAEPFRDGQLVRVFIQVQYLRYLGVHAFTYMTGAASEEAKTNLQKADKEFFDIIRMLDEKRLIPANYAEIWAFEKRSFSSVQGIGMNASELPLAEEGEDCPLLPGHVICVTLDEDMGHGMRAIRSDTFFVSSAGIVSACGSGSFPVYCTDN
jgi:Xaa-Pro aminopeptidase